MYSSFSDVTVLVISLDSSRPTLKIDSSWRIPLAEFVPFRCDLDTSGVSASVASVVIFFYCSKGTVWRERRDGIFFSFEGRRGCGSNKRQNERINEAVLWSMAAPCEAGMGRAAELLSMNAIRIFPERFGDNEHHDCILALGTHIIR